MHKLGSDPKVKKTLVRNCEKKVKQPLPKHVVYDVESCSSKDKLVDRPKEKYLDQPTLCSSEALAQYLGEVKVSAHSPLTQDELNVDRDRIYSQVTKKLNFHFNDRIYRNLIELNASVEDLKKKKEKRPCSSNSKKRDVEPNIDDFYEEIKDDDVPPIIPVVKHKFKTVKPVENGYLHKIVSAYEDL